MQATSKALAKRHRRVRKRVVGTAERPRLAVYRSNKHIYAQIVDDGKAQILMAASDLELEKGADGKTKAEVAGEVGKIIAKKARAKKIGKVVFDRGGRLYHGRVKALADGAREGGLEF